MWKGPWMLSSAESCLWGKHPRSRALCPTLSQTQCLFSKSAQIKYSLPQCQLPFPFSEAIHHTVSDSSGCSEDGEGRQARDNKEVIFAEDTSALVFNEKV